MDTYKKEIVRIDRLATGGTEDGLQYDTKGKNVLEHCQPAEYVPELLDIPLRNDLKPLNVLQPEGASFTVSDDSLIEWQKWRFRVGYEGFPSPKRRFVADNSTDLLPGNALYCTISTMMAVVSCTV